MKVKNCQVCNSIELEEIISLGYLPHPNKMQEIGSLLEETLYIPHELLRCKNCTLVQLGFIADQTTVFPPDYAYTSRTTKILRDNFAQLAEEVFKVVELKKDDLVIDVGSNDGTLLSNFKEKCRVIGIEPTNACRYANENGIPTIQEFFSPELADELSYTKGKAKAIFCTNCYAHMPDPNALTDAIEGLLDDDGIFVSENHYLVDMLKTVQFDVIYTEHLRFYSLTSLKYLLEKNGLEIFDVKKIPTHGGGIRVYSCKRGKYKVQDSVNQTLKDEQEYLTSETFDRFANEIIMNKLGIYYEIFSSVLEEGREATIGAIGAPSRSTTLVNYFGLNEYIINWIAEAPGSSKIDRYLPGTKIPIVEETPELLNSVNYLLMLSWHISDELIPKIKEKGYKGKFIIPLPYPRIVE